MLEDTEELLHQTAVLAKQKNLRGLTFTMSDIGDLYHVYGVNATAHKFLAMIVRRNNLTPKRKTTHGRT